MQRPACGAEDHLIASWLQPLHHDSRAGQRGVPAQWHLDSRGEPAQSIVVAIANQESRLGKIVLGRDGLHGRVVQEAVQHHHRGGIPGEPSRGECIDLEHWNAHGGVLLVHG